MLYEREIYEMHAFIRAWFRAELPKTEQAFARMSRAIADTFTLIAATGRIVERETVMRGFYDRHGAYPDYAFRIENVSLRHRVREIAVCTYQLEETDSVRSTHVVIVSLVFREQASAPNGLEHLHVHETWVQQ